MSKRKFKKTGCTPLHRCEDEVYSADFSEVSLMSWYWN
jgi:hypothetical protein